MALFTPGDLLTAGQAVLQAVSTDVVAIYDQNYKQLFNQFLLGNRIQNPFLSGARPRKAEVLISSKLMSHPLESGAQIVDHRVRNLIEIRIPMLVSLPTGVDMILGNNSIFSEIKRYYDDSALLIVQTKSGIYPNMVIEEMPEVEDAEYFSTLQIELRLKEAPFVQSKYVVSTSVPKNSNPVQQGQVSQKSSGNIIGIKEGPVSLQTQQQINNAVNGNYSTLPISKPDIKKINDGFNKINPFPPH